MTDTPLLGQVFECCADMESIAGAKVLKVAVNKAKQSMTIEVQSAAPIAPMMLTLAEARIKSSMPEMKSVKMSASAPPPPKKQGKKQAGEVLLGNKPIKGSSIKMTELTPESGRVTVEGEVFAFEERAWKTGGGKTILFNLTDNHSSARIKTNTVINVQNGDTVRVQGNYIFDRYYNDYLIEPTGIERIEKSVRSDSSEAKRVELHLHTKMSAVDALTDIEEAVKTAARWGHKAIAMTDHAVVHDFPRFADAAKKAGIKPIFGVEAYYVNDIDDRLVTTVVDPASVAPISEYVVFDLETTGLDQVNDRITEIGAVLVRDGVAAERFSMMVNPGFPIPPEIVRLTGITDADVAMASGEDVAVPKFLEFAAGRTLVAHNADFDSGVIIAACTRLGLEFTNVSVDTVALAQNLLPELTKYNLAALATYMQLPDFNHHRAVDDAETLSKIMEDLRERLEKIGICDFTQIDDYFRPQRAAFAVKDRWPKHIILLVKEQKGLKNLYTLISKSHLNPFTKGFPVMTKTMIQEYREGLIVGSACENSEVFRSVSGGNSDRELLRLSEFYDYFEIQPLANNLFMLENNNSRYKTVEQLRNFNRRIVRLGEITGKPTVATGDVHFLEPEHEIFRRILTANKFKDADRDLPLYLKTTTEMLEEFEYLGKEKAFEVVVTNPNLIADSVEKIRLLPEGLCKPELENSKEELETLVYGKLKDLYGENAPELVQTRVRAEMTDIINCGYDVIYLSAHKLVKRSNDNGYLVGSRGSVGSSFAAFLAGITEVNALPPHYRCPNCLHSDFEIGAEYGAGADLPDALCPVCGTAYEKDGFDIPFEIFLGFSGDKVPDIDLNFSGEYQAEAHRHAAEMFGSDKVFRAGTIGTLAEKTAFGYVKNYCSERGLVISKAEEDRLSRALTGVKKTTGQHPGGLVVIPTEYDVEDFCPVQHPGDEKDREKKEHIITTHIEYHAMEDNLLKLDMLGHDDPSMCKMLTDLTGVDVRSLPIADKDVLALFTAGKGDEKLSTVGVPEFGTAFTRGMLEDTKPARFSTLIRLSGFSHGTDVWLGNAKDLIMKEHLAVEDVIGCRDDIMQYLMGLGMQDKKA
ncbi:MAG: PolC-type DNA polymerase III, partial [Oscillospiraceae bacterium]|nr:PolC-type DNA polymerase III [Oscillospiraceae bacterium]